jgi:deazaflavin-dependent oxidoreductase (nitroreductase family)
MSNTTDFIHDFNRSLIAEFRATDGKMDSPSAQKLMAMMTGRNPDEQITSHPPLLLLTTIGARSGQPRIAPLAYTTDGDHFIVIASKGGAPSNPDWYYNLVVNHTVTVEVGSEKFQAQATVPEGQERERLYTQMAEQLPQFNDYQKKTSRQIPVVVLKRTE